MQKRSLLALAALMMVASCAEPELSEESPEMTSEMTSETTSERTSAEPGLELRLNSDETGRAPTCPTYNPPGFRCQSSADCIAVCSRFGDLGGSCLPTLKCCICRM